MEYDVTKKDTYFEANLPEEAKITDIINFLQDMRKGHESEQNEELCLIGTYIYYIGDVGDEAFYMNNAFDSEGTLIKPQDTEESPLVEIEINGPDGYLVTALKRDGDDKFCLKESCMACDYDSIDCLINMLQKIDNLDLIL